MRSDQFLEWPQQICCDSPYAESTWIASRSLPAGNFIKTVPTSKFTEGKGMMRFTDTQDNTRWLLTHFSYVITQHKTFLVTLMQFSSLLLWKFSGLFQFLCLNHSILSHHVEKFINTLLVKKPVALVHFHKQHWLKKKKKNLLTMQQQSTVKTDTRD